MTRVGYVYDPLYLAHGWPGHPESPDRLRLTVSHLQEFGVFDKLIEIPARDACRDDLELVHSKELIDQLQVRTEEGSWPDPDTYIAPKSYEVAARAVGGCLAALDAIVDGQVDSAFCLVRPPGHHATPDKAMGFCLFNNVAIAAAHALERRGLERVAILDFDVHHGNGIQDVFYADPRVLYFSTHQYPFYPSSGYWAEAGEGEGHGTTVNVPLPRGCLSDQYLQIYRDICAPIVRRYKPQLILVSAGFDAHFADPLAQELVNTEAYYEIASLLRGLADEMCQGHIMFALEGGYHLAALACSVQACLEALLGESFSPDTLGAGPQPPPPNIDTTLEAVKRTHGLE